MARYKLLGYSYFLITSEMALSVPLEQMAGGTGRFSIGFRLDGRMAPAVLWGDFRSKSPVGRRQRKAHFSRQKLQTRDCILCIS